MAAIFGLVAFRYPVPSAVAACSAFCLWRLHSPGTGQKKLKSGLLGLFFCLGVVWGWLAEPLSWGQIRTAAPRWLHEAVSPGYEKTSPYATGVAIEGRIQRVEQLAGKRLRVVMDRFRHDAPHNVPYGALSPEGAKEEVEKEPSYAPAGLVITWQSPPPEYADTGPGQTLRATVRLREIRGFANPGSWSPEQHWLDQGIAYRAGINGDASRDGKAPPVTVDGTAHAWWRWRQLLRNQLVALLSFAHTAAPHDAGGIAPAPPAQLSQPSAMLVALLLGERSFLSRETLDLFSRATLSHSLALSGLHLGFAAAMGYAAAAGLGFVWPRIFLRSARPRLSILLGIAPTLFYLWLGAAPPSLVRAALMLFFWAFLLWRNKPKVLLDGLIWAVAVILLADPLAIYDLRLQLSALSVAGIALVLPASAGALRRVGQFLSTAPLCLRPKLSWLAGFVLPLLFISLAAQLSVMPLTVRAFNTLSPWFIANLFWLPPLGLVVMPAAFAGLALLGLSLLLPAWAGALASGAEQAAAGAFALAALPCQWALEALTRLASAGQLQAPVVLRPHWLSCIGFWLLLLCLALAYGRRTARASRTVFTRDGRTVLLGCAFLLIAAPFVPQPWQKDKDGVSLRVLDVGQGQSLLIEWPGGRALVDGGGFSGDSFDVGRQLLAPLLTDNRLPRLDRVINTHPDTDHLGGLLYILQTFQVGSFAAGPDRGNTDDTTSTVMHRRDAILRQNHIPRQTLYAGDSIPLSDALSLELLHPPASASGPGTEKRASANNMSLVLRLVWKGRGLALICGDVERAGLNSMLARGSGPGREQIPGQIPKVPELPDMSADVLIVPHHGSAGSFEPELYSRVRPALAVVSAGYGNQWNFPARSVRRHCENTGTPLLSTAEHGQVHVTWNESAMTVRTARD